MIIIYLFVDFKNVKIRDLAKLRDSKRLLDIMQQIDVFQSRLRSTEDVLGPVESDPEYLLIVEANNLIVEIDDEICKILINIHLENNLTSFCFIFQ